MIGWIVSFIALILGPIMLGQRVVQVSLAAEGFQ